MSNQRLERRLNHIQTETTSHSTHQKPINVQITEDTRKLTIRKDTLQKINKNNRNKAPHLHVAKDRTISRKTKKSNEVLLNNQLKKNRQSIVFDRFKNQLINDHIEDTDVGFQAIHSANVKRRSAVRGVRTVKNVVQANNRKRYVANNIRQGISLQFQGSIIGAMESESAVEDTGYTAVGQASSNVQATNEVLQKGREKVRNTKVIRERNTVRERKRIEQMKQVGKDSAEALQKGAKGVVEALKTFVAQAQSAIASNAGLFVALFFGLILVMGVAIGGSGTSLEMEEEQRYSLTADGLHEDVLQWREPLENELAKYNLTEYTDLLLVIIKLESNGRLPDVMQSSESLGLAPNTITDPIESIKAGVQHFRSIYGDMMMYNVDIQTLIQAYNFGNNFIQYVAKNGNVWKQKHSDDFSAMWANRLGWKSFGDTQYVVKVMRYLSIEDDEIKLNGNFEFDLKGQKLAFPVPNHTALSSSYGWRTDPISGERKFHSGIDIPAPTGTPVIAVADGIVTESGWKGGLGNAVVIDHGSNIRTVYGHNSSLIVHAGQTVEVGDVIALVGSTGYSTGAHSHFEVHRNGQYTDPMKWLQ